jgi:hypothetical protein
MKKVKVPPEAQFLESRGNIEFNIEKEGPAPAWTYWNDRKKRWSVCVREDIANVVDDEEMTVLLRHELAHIMLGHFRIECHEMDSLISADVAVNWWIKPEMLDRIDEKIQGRSIRPKEVMEELGLGTKHYIPQAPIHDLLHEKMEDQREQIGQALKDMLEQMGDGEGMCGGMEGDVPEEDKARASAIAAVLGVKAKSEAEEGAYGEMHTPGAQAGGINLPPGHKDVPPWVEAVQEFAKAIVRSTLADRRSNQRPVQPLRAVGLHVPSMKPKWAYVPDTVCLLVDVSGSMMNLLPQVAPAIEYLQRHQLKVRVIAGDTRVTFDEELSGPLPNLVGGGGTEIVPLFDRAEDYNPRALIVFTDGYVQKWPSKKEHMSIDTLWVCDDVQPPYGKTVSTKGEKR